MKSYPQKTLYYVDNFFDGICWFITSNIVKYMWKKQRKGQIELDRQEILSKYINDDRLLVSKLLDKIEFVNKRNSVEYTEFLDMRQRQLLEKVMAELKVSNYVATGGYKTAERTVLVIYPEKLEEIIQNEQFDFNTIFAVVRISLPNELKGMYSHRDYLGAIIKIGMRREKVGDIITSKDGADLIVLKEAEKYITSGLKELTRFSKAEFQSLRLEELNIEEPKTQVIDIIIPSMRIDSIVSEIIRTSRAKAMTIIKEERVFVNHELITKGSKEVKENDIITVRGKGRFKVGKIVNSTRKGNLVLKVEKYVWERKKAQLFTFLENKKCCEKACP